MNRFKNAITFLEGMLAPTRRFLPQDLQNEIAQLFEFVKSEGKMKIFRALKHLQRVGSVTVSACKRFVIRDFFKIGKNGITKIWMSDEFIAKILNDAPEAAACAETNLEKFTLSKGMLDSQISNELGNVPPYSIAEFLSIVRSMVAKQPNGEAGDLISNGYANIFYVKATIGRAVVARVRWSSGDSEWRCNCFGFDGDGRWRAGVAVLSPATDA